MLKEILGALDAVHKSYGVGASGLVIVKRSIVFGRCCCSSFFLFGYASHCFVVFINCLLLLYSSSGVR